jgi:outer membrane lipoprotein carrier protein
MNKALFRRAVFWVAPILIAACALSVRAEGLDSLEVFIKGVQSARAQFQQTVVSPAREGQAARRKVSSGTFEFQRPNRFKFVYLKPFEQTIVADGQTLWLYDADLYQVTIRKQSAALGSTPAALIASAANLAALQSEFSMVSQPLKDGLEWVLATPKAKDSTLQAVRLGFKGPALMVLEILDSFGQTSTMNFSAFQANPVMDASVFQFKIPNGADVIRQ